MKSLLKITSIIALVIIFVFSSGNANAADELRIGYKYPGYIIKNNNDTIYGYIKYNNVVKNQKKCEFFKNEMDKKPSKVYSTKDLKGYLVSSTLYKTINYSGGLFSKPLRFLEVSKDGELTMFVFYEEGSIPYNTERPTTMVYYKWHDKNFPKPITNEKFAFSFAKKVSKYVADNKELSNKVKNKEKGYKLVNLYEIIDEYNTWYSENN